MKTISVNLTIIGKIHSPYLSPSDVPLKKTDNIFTIEIEKEFMKGLTDLEGFSHLHIFYWLHKSTGFSLMVYPPWDKKPHGLFATCSPHRPNPVAHCVVECIEIKKNFLYVKGLDAIQGTPVIDIKPYIKKNDCKPDAACGWLNQVDLK
ncbi:MAG: tRNA (N6-threonylcarbamoyladenosine(37)-N6)-methyltransferase TrmO [Thermoplasmatota archaeon]